MKSAGRAAVVLLGTAAALASGQSPASATASPRAPKPTAAATATATTRTRTRPVPTTLPAFLTRPAFLTHPSPGPGPAAPRPASPAQPPAPAAVAGTPARGKTPPAARPVASPVAPPAAGSCAAVVQGWTVQQLAARTVTVPVDQRNTADVLPMVRAGAGGVILFGNTVPSDLKQRLADLHAAAPQQPPAISTDEEGGGIQRVASAAGSLPWPRDAANSQTPDQVRTSVAAVARKMHDLGIDLDLAPVLDLDAGPGPDNDHPDGKRSFSADRTKAQAYGEAFIRGLADGAVAATVKHFPGLGTATRNTDIGAATTAPFATLQDNDLLPFVGAITDTTTAVMMSNAVTPGLTDGQPAGLSDQAVRHLLRATLGFDGPVVTDSLSAKAISDAGYTLPQAAVAAIQAGDDMLLYGPAATLTENQQDFTAIVDAIVAAVGDDRIALEDLRAAAARDLQLRPGACTA